jgi:hypothetical protein
MDRSNSLNLAYYGESLAFLVCVNYGVSFREWFGQIKEDKELLRNLELAFEEEEGNDEWGNIFCEVGCDRIYYRMAYRLCYWHLYIVRGVN